MGNRFDLFLSRQLEKWQLARVNYEALSEVETKQFVVESFLYKVQFNPARRHSSTAKIDKKSIAERPCFLCKGNLPLEQDIIAEEDYLFLINPFPIFERHLTIARNEHTQQSIRTNFRKFITFSEQMYDYSLLYNGPMCGASAPDHMHFQAIDKETLPIVQESKERFDTEIATYGGVSIYVDVKDLRHTILLRGADRDELCTVFEKIYDLLPILPLETEPRMNLLAWTSQGEQFLALFPRAKHRPDCYSAEGEESMLISPGSVDMGGVFIATRRSDFDKIQAENIRQIIQEVSMDKALFMSIIESIKDCLTHKP